jgi:L-ribulose-5-phosphate 3-epimerase UlaE
MLAANELTQLEWVDLCANELNLDGVEFALTHFPRLDADYVAQVKKLCADRCLTVASLHHDLVVTSDGITRHVTALERSLDLALQLGAPLVRFALHSSQAPQAVEWREMIHGLKTACSKAKQLNVTFALEPTINSPVASPGDARRAIKECDSAWLRLATNARALGASSRDQWAEAIEVSSIAIAPVSSLDTFGADESIDYLAALSMLWQQRFRGFLSLEYSGEEAERPAVARAVSWLRGMVAKDELKAAVTS